MSLADFLLAEGVISREQRDRALEESDAKKVPVLRVLQEMGALSDADRIKVLHRKANIPVVSLEDVVPRPEVAGFISRDICRHHRVVPVRKESGGIMVAMEDPTDIDLIADLEKVFGTTVRPVLAPLSDIMETIDRLPESGAPTYAEPEARSWTKGLLSTVSLIILAFGPIVGSFYFININEFGREWYASYGFTNFETGLVFLIAWGCWASLAYFLNDLIFGTPKE
jgi:hypothetical protein